MRFMHATMGLGSQRSARLNNTLAYVEHIDMAFGSVTYVGELRIVMGR